MASKTVRQLEAEYKAACTAFSTVWQPKLEKIRKFNRKFDEMKKQELLIVAELRRGILAVTALQALKVELDDARKRDGSRNRSRRKKVRVR